MDTSLRKKEAPMRVLAVIPARYGSTRFEGKPLADILGKPMIQHVYEGLSESNLIERIVVATDDQRIVEAVQSFGGNAVMTSPHHRAGTDRVAEVARRFKAEIIANVQGDEPLIKGRTVDRAIRPLLTDDTLLMSTLVTRFQDRKDWVSPNTAKVVVDRKGYALYFSRAPIPFPRDSNMGQPPSLSVAPEEPFPTEAFKHIGVYVFRRRFLFQYAKMSPTPLENLEKLEQLRVLEHGYRIKVAAVDYEPLCVDTPEDLERVIASFSRTP